MAVTNRTIDGNVIITATGEPVPARSFAGRARQAWRVLRGKPVVAVEPVVITNCVINGHIEYEPA